MKLKAILIIVIILCIVSCKKDTPKPVELNKISIKTPPTKIEYYIGEILDISGLVITLTMNNGNTEDIVFSDFVNNGITCSPANGTKLNLSSTLITITHTATGKVISQIIKIINLKDIKVKTPPSKLKYEVGETLNLTGLVVELIWNNGVTKDIVFSDFENNDLNYIPKNGTTLSIETTTIKITHTLTEKTVSQNIISIGYTADIENNTYSIVKIGSLTWMAENLRTTTYNNGMPIPLKEDTTNWSEDKEGAYCWFNNDKVTYSNIYGALYNWYTVETEKLCPNGWHVSTDDEWTELTDYLVVNGYENVEGNTLKATIGWNNDGNGTDNYGFEALPGGFRQSGGSFVELGNSGYWWCFKDEDTFFAYPRRISYNTSNVEKLNGYMHTWGFSVRCVKD